jgi:hypothetical protein
MGDYASERQTKVGAAGRFGNTGNDNSETVHEESGTTDTISPCKGAEPLAEEQRSAAAPVSATDVTVPAPIATQNADQCAARNGQLSEATRGRCRRRS